MACVVCEARANRRDEQASSSSCLVARGRSVAPGRTGSGTGVVLVLLVRVARAELGYLIIGCVYKPRAKQHQEGF